jgi:hypothetical protein
MDQLPLEKFFENSRLELLVCQNSFIVSYVKSWPPVGRSVDYGKKACGEKCWLWEKGGVFENLDQILLEYLSFLSLQVDLT